MNTIIHLRGFQQLMSFLGSVGCVMESRGLQYALETLYAPIRVIKPYVNRKGIFKVDLWLFFLHLQL